VLADGVSEASLAVAGEEALAHLDPGDDIHATAAYRSRLARVLTTRVLRTAYDDARLGGRAEPRPGGREESAP
jgi:carbon-monoxide dehydrogenase medium subunit